MRSNNREDVAEAFRAMAVAVERAQQLSFDEVTARECVTLLERCEELRRRLPTVEHRLINEVKQRADLAELGGRLHWGLADRLRITRDEARRRVDEAAELGPRRVLTGAYREPVLPGTAAGQRAGRISTAHVRVIRRFFRELPDQVDVGTRRDAEVHLAKLAGEYRPDELRLLAAKLFDCLVPDGIFSDIDRARRRTVILGGQGADGMSQIKGWLTPEARATLDAVLARLAAPGMCNPADPAPCLSGTPSRDAIQADSRSAGQRNHDALTAMGRAVLASGELGQHNGLPATIIISASLDELRAAAGKVSTGGGTWLSVRDLIRLAAKSHHYLRIFEGAKELKLYHARRIASPAQRLVLYARDRGCTHPGCTVPGYLTEAHHVTDYAQNPVTDVDGLTPRCGPHHELITSGGWSTRRRADGQVETIPPAHLDHGQPRTNRYHHPERLLCDSTGDDDDAP